MRDLVRIAVATADLGGGGPGTRVIVVSDQRLMRDAVRTALRSVGVTAASLGLPKGTVQVHAARRWIAKIGPAVGLLVTEIDDASQLRDAAAVVGVLAIPWLVLTSTPASAAWGALIEAGVQDVLGADTGLEDLQRALARLAAGEPPLSARDHEEALRDWLEAPEERRQLIRRLEALSPREMEILIDLNSGDSPKVIAARVGVSEGTVRSQVKSMLRKLEVSSQLQAVASYRQLNSWIVG